MEKITMSKKSTLTINEAFELFIRKCKIKNLTVPEGTEISDMAFGMWPEAMKKVPNLKIRYL